MADAIVSVFLEKLLNTLAEEGLYVTKFREQFEKLQTELQLMQCFLKDADRLKRKNDTINKVLAVLRELIYEAEDILADCQLQSRDDALFSNGCLTCISPPILHFKHQNGKRIKEIIGEITQIKQNIQSLLGGTLLFQPNAINGKDQMPRWSSQVYDHTMVVGLEADTKKIKDWLFEAAREGKQEILAIGVVGMGGLGKTTISQKVYNEKEIDDHFDRRMWVSVSQTFTEEQIMRSMLRNLGDASVGDDANELLKKINQYLLGKRYLIVMDDVWGEDVAWWGRISQGRNERVSRKMGVKETRIHRPKFLNKDYSWLLFQKIAFAASEGQCIYPDLEDVGKEIVDKCEGLPLAIKAVGGMMLCKASYYHEWRRIADHFRDELAENDDSVMASLQLSYDELPPYLKSCFLSFSLYPDDCVITKQQVVHWWIGEGFVPLRSGRSSTDADEDCFSGLINRCLIEVVDKTYNGTILTCKMHMVRELVIKIAKDDTFSVTNNTNCRHSGITNNMDRKQLTANPKLRGLVSTTKSGEVNKIESSTAKKLSDSLLFHIGSLHHLTYLSLSNTHPSIELPASLEKLTNLQILDLSYCQNLRTLPHNLITLRKLKVLDVSNCGSLECLPKGLGRLSNLEVLLGFRPARSSHGCRIGELRNLTRLRILGLHLTHADEVEENEVNAMANLHDLENLSISCFDSHGSDLTSKLDKLYPPQQLYELSLKFYPGKMSPAWLNPIALPLLKYLSISSGNLANVNQNFWGYNNIVWKIQGLMLESLSDLELEWPMLQEAMQSLRIVNVSWCPELVSFPIDDVGFRGGEIFSLQIFKIPYFSFHFSFVFTQKKRDSSREREMDPDSVKSTLSNLAFGNVMAAAARDYQKELLAQEKAQSSTANEEVDLDELMDDPELEKLHADRIAALKKEAEKREALKRQGHGDYREITEGDFLGEVTGSETVVCHFYHKEFYRCKIMDKHLKALAPKHMDTKFIKLDAENAPFFVTKLAVKTLPCVIIFRKGVAVDRLVGFQDLGAKDDFAMRTLEVVLIKKGIISEKKNEDDEDDVYDESRRRTVRSSVNHDSDSD
ncbi:hypothetical protein ERO13_A12G062700v2 [Gossypium hirsutum]|nr:hypothetical protein ERO13_A12G062700v2 [Gossypium hirsutum]